MNLQRQLWKDFISEALEITKENISDEAMENILDTIKLSIENSDIYTGIIEQTKSLNFENKNIQTIKEDYKNQIDILEKDIQGVKEYIACEHNVRIRDIDINSGKISIHGIEIKHCR